MADETLKVWNNLKRMSSFFMNKQITDQSQREEALDPQRSFIVQAPAGSGKTELLINRFLMLLATVESPEQIIAITFTRKAAGEMHCRIVDALNKAGKGIIPETAYNRTTVELAKKVLSRSDELGWRLLETPGRLKIQTIDSLCSFLTKRIPILSGLGSRPSVAEYPGELYREAARRTIALSQTGGRDGDAVCRTLRHLDNSFENLEKRLIVMLKNRDQWLRHVNLRSNIDEDNLRKLLENSVRQLISNHLQKVRKAFHEDLLMKALEFGRFAAANLLAEEREAAPSDITHLDNLYDFPKAEYNELPVWRGIRELLLTAGNKWRKSVNKKTGFPAGGAGIEKTMKDGFKSFIDSVSQNDDLLKMLGDISTLPSGSYNEKEWTLLNDLLHLLPLANRELMNVFAEKGEVDFQMIAMAAASSLGAEDEPTELMLSLDLKIQHILVDEFQDTSRSQLRLLEALTGGWQDGDGRTLFIVGDPMQSIYLFREAEVGLFLMVRDKGIGCVKFHQLTLRSNFRSEAGIVEWINNTFYGAFHEREDPLLGSIRYEKFTPVIESSIDQSVKVRLFNGRDDCAEAIEIVETVKSIRKGSAGETIAVLARSRSHLKEIVKGLKEAEIDFATKELDPLFERAVVQDLFSLLRALMHPFDKIAWLAILRAPWCGLTLREIQSLVMPPSKKSVPELMNDEDRIEKLSADGKKRLLNIRQKLEKALACRGKIPPRKVLEGLWVAIGGPACVDGDSMNHAEAFFELVEKTSAAGEIESLGALKSMIEGLFANHDGETDNPVQLLTIHKAKGLEFDHVIIPGLGKPPRSNEKKLLLTMERGEGGGQLLLAPIDGMGGVSETYEYLSSIHSKKEMLEQVRLFYVAATRAKKQLFLFGHFSVTKNGDIKTEGKSLLSTIEDSIMPDFPIEENGEKNMGESSAALEKPDEQYDLKLKRLSADWKLPEPADRINTILDKNMENIETAKPEFLWAGESIKNLGVVMHRYFCRIAEEGLNKWDDHRVDKESGKISAYLRELGLNRKEADIQAVFGIKTLKKLLRNKRARWILSDHREAGSEISLSAVIGKKVIHRTLDRTFVDENNIRWVIDYKVSRHEGTDIDRFMQNEKERYMKQLEDYAAILKAGGEKREIKKGLYYPVQSGWIEW